MKSAGDHPLVISAAFRIGEGKCHISAIIGSLIHSCYRSRYVHIPPKNFPWQTSYRTKLNLLPRNGSRPTAQCSRLKKPELRRFGRSPVVRSHLARSRVPTIERPSPPAENPNSARVFTS